MKAPNTVGKRLILARNERGMRQIDVAEIIGVTDRSIQAYENDEVIPYRFVNQLSGVLGKSVAWILHGEEAAKEPGDNLTPLLEQILERVDLIAKAIPEKPKTATRRTAPKPASKTKTSRAKKTTPRKRS